MYLVGGRESGNPTIICKRRNTTFSCMFRVDLAYFTPIEFQSRPDEAYLNGLHEGCCSSRPTPALDWESSSAGRLSSDRNASHSPSRMRAPRTHRAERSAGCCWHLRGKDVPSFRAGLERVGVGACCRPDHRVDLVNGRTGKQRVRGSISCHVGRTGHRGNNCDEPYRRRIRAIRSRQRSGPFNAQRTQAVPIAASDITRALIPNGITPEYRPKHQRHVPPPKC